LSTIDVLTQSPDLGYSPAMKYFAYGSNMDMKQMASRCPEASLLGWAQLPGYVFRINHYGVATVVPSTSTVYGVLWKLSLADEARLDCYEGVQGGFYTKNCVKVEDHDLHRTEALIYLAANTEEGPPRPGYLEAIIKAARFHRFPEAYVAQLHAWRNPKRA
jgi:gamma-glutamylcyclotransferase (GGCT)/AIG2-like uncharacterized protein YtfP